MELSKREVAILDFLKQIDILIDGRFILAKKSYDVIFRGSKNQRIIDVKESLKKNRTVLITKYDKKDKNNKGRKNHYMYV